MADGAFALIITFVADAAMLSMPVLTSSILVPAVFIIAVQCAEITHLVELGDSRHYADNAATYHNVLHPSDKSIVYQTYEWLDGQEWRITDTLVTTLSIVQDDPTSLHYIKIDTIGNVYV